MKSASLSQTIDVDTPELVVLSYTIAGVGSRASAALIDYLFCFFILIVLTVGAGYIGLHFGAKKLTDNSGAWIIAVLGIFQFALLWLYYVLFEALADGRTPGKRIMRLRVVRDGGLAINFEASAIRNLVRIVDLQPVLLYAVGMLTMIINSRGKRLGDIAAGTIVVKEDLVSQPMTSKQVRVSDSAMAPLLASKLSEPEFALLDRFMQRRMQLDVARRNTLAKSLTERLTHALNADADTDVTRLARLHEQEIAIRALGVASRHATGAARERHAIVATNAPRWTAFAHTLERAQKSGLNSLGEAGVRSFVQEYRELAADLARLRTAARDDNSPDVFYLNRLVAGAHSRLYRRSTITLHGILDFIFLDVPAEIRRSFRPLALSAALLFVPIVITARAIVLHPALATQLLPPAMMERAAKGVENAKTGKGYIEDPQMLRPLFASKIMTNNIQVVFLAFAFGITAGIFTVVMLVSNGVSIGAVYGLYHSKGIATLLLAFVAAHGVFELTAIVIGGGGGFLLAAGMLIPGNRTRRAALANNGRRAIKLVAGAAFLLVFAGTLEGFVSPNANITPNVKFAIAAFSAMLLLAYIRPFTGLRARLQRAPVLELEIGVHDARSHQLG
jgi:uncharacterized membrane protein SpoIIM required for sporulation/uncharacterized RDD family membrane protein YckC